MIYYMTQPLDLLQGDPAIELQTINLPSGGLLQLEIVDSHQARVAALISTDPMDYMQADYQPGSLLEISFNLRS